MITADILTTGLKDLGSIQAEHLLSSRWIAVSRSAIPSGLGEELLSQLDMLPERIERILFSSELLIDGLCKVPLLNKHYLPEIVFLRSSRFSQERLGQYGSWDDLIADADRLTLTVQDAFALLCRYSNHYVQAGCLITDFCNLNCKMCMFHSSDDGYAFSRSRLSERGRQKIAKDRMLSFIDQIPQSRRILFSASGEIFTCKSETLTYFEHARGRPLDVGFISNGGLLDERTASLIAEIGISDAIFSVDGHTAEVYNEIRRGGDFETTVKNIRHFIRIASAAPKHITTAINTILFKPFETRKNEIVKFWKTVGVDRHNFLVERLDYLGKPRSLLVEVNENLRECCFDPFQGPILLPNGDIAPCCSVAIGAYFEPMDWLCSIDKIGLDQAVRQYRQMLLNPDSPLKRYCRKCQYWPANYTFKGHNPFSETVEFSAKPATRGFFRRLRQKWA